MSDDTQKIILEYSKEYCLFLEKAYGSSMLSEGGTEAIDRMLAKENIVNKKILDIGFGLGGVAHYLAEKYGANLYGIEINPWMVTEATYRTPENLKQKVKFSVYDPENQLDFTDNFFDVVYSKGVLTHLKKKDTLFKEVNRILQFGGSFVIEDWLSPYSDHFGPRVNEMCKLEGLTLYPKTEDDYKKLLEKHNFINIEMRDENSNYYRYNIEIVERLKKNNPNEILFDHFTLGDAVKSYQFIADAIKDNELLIRWIRGKKPKL